MSLFKIESHTTAEFQNLDDKLTNECQTYTDLLNHLSYMDTHNIRGIQRESMEEAMENCLSEIGRLIQQRNA